MVISSGFFKSQSFRNVIWMFSDKVIRLVLGVLIGVLITRQLGPSQFGQWNYVIAIISLLASLANLGMDSILLNELVEHKDSSFKKIFFTTITLRFISGILGYMLLVIILYFGLNVDVNLLLLFLLVGSNLIWQTSDSFDIFFQFNQKIKQATIVKYFSFGISTILKIVGLVLKLPLVYFVLVSVIELLLYFFIIILTYIKLFGRLEILFDFRIFNGLLKKGLPLLLSSFLIILYMRTDQIMLGYLKGDFEVGIYSSALKLSEIWYFIPTVIVSAFSAEILSLKSQNEVVFEEKIKVLMSILIYFSIIFGLFVSFFSKEIVSVIYGSEFLLSSSVLTIHIWTGVFVCIGICSNLVSISDNQNYLIFYKSISGAVINILLNFLFIPLMSSQGSALATALSYFFVTCISDLFWKDSHRLWRLKLESFILPFKYMLLK